MSDIAVYPVVDYEPPVFGGPPKLPPPAAPRYHRTPAVLARRSPADGYRTHAAAVFADAALRRVLEVVDKRRPVAQLLPLMAAGLVDSLPAAAGLSPARLQRVVAQICRPDGTAAEVTANYTRAGRLHAIACRVEQVHTTIGPRTGPRWRVVALHMG